MLTIKPPTQCHLWGQENIDPINLDMNLLKVFVRSAHLERDLQQCRKCGQLYFHEWYEHLSFKHDDDTYDTYIPIQSEEDASELLEAKTSADLVKYVPQLHGSYTNNHNDALSWRLEAPKG